MKLLSMTKVLASVLLGCGVFWIVIPERSQAAYNVNVVYTNGLVRTAVSDKWVVYAHRVAALKLQAGGELTDIRETVEIVADPGTGERRKVKTLLLTWDSEEVKFIRATLLPKEEREL